MITEEIKEFPRIEVLADIIVDNKQKKFAAVTFNISRGGISFVSSAPLAVGEKCLVYLKKNRNFFQQKGMIKWMKQIDAKTDMIKYGFEFREPITQNEFDLFIKCCN